MKFLLKITAFFLFLFLLTGCSTEIPGEVPENQPSEELISAEENLFTSEDEEKLLHIATIYEISDRGSNLGENESIYPGNSTAFAYLSLNLLEGSYQEAGGSTYYVPGRVLKVINEFLFVNIEPADSEDFGERNFAFGGEWNSLPYALTPEKIERTGDGKISATFLREIEGAVLTPVTFVFAAETAGEVPNELSSLYETGDTVYKIESVTQRPDLLPAAEPQTIEISNAEELLAAVKRINEGKYENQWDTYVLTADIDLSGIEWTPIGLNTPVLEFWDQNGCDPNLRGFNGTFDGQGFTIYNLTITEEQSVSLLSLSEQHFPERKNTNVGFFACIGDEGTVRNLHIKNADITLPDYYVSDYGMSGGILAATCSGRVDSVAVQGKISGFSAIGGMIGTLGGADSGNAYAKDCQSDVEVTGTSQIGGMISLLHYATIENCSSKGIVTAVPSSGRPNEMPGGFGGMAAHIIEGHAINCHAACYVLTKVPSAMVGGFCGLAEGGSITSCSVNAKKAGNWEAIDDIHRIENPDIVIE